MGHTSPQSREQSAAPVRARIAWLVVPGFILLGFLVYANSLDVPFQFDDGHNILENPSIRMTQLSWSQLSQAALSYAGKRPLPMLSFALNYYFGEYQVLGYHVGNVLIHVVNAILLFLLVQITLAFRRREGQGSPRHGIVGDAMVALFAALIWFVHPVHTQSVTYIVQRMNSMSAMFFLLALFLYAKGRSIQRGAHGDRLRHKHLKGGQRGPGPYGCFVGCGVSWLLALASKEIAVTLPFFVLLYEWTFLQDLRWQWLWRRLGWLAGAAGTVVLLAFVYLGNDLVDGVLSTYAPWDFTIGERVLTQFRVVMLYLGLLVFPHPSRLLLDYDFSLSSSLVQPPTTLVALIAIAALLLLAVTMARRGEQLLFFAVLWFLGNLALESSIIGLDLVFEHRTYLPYMFPCVAGADLAFRAMRPRWTALAALGAVAVVLSIWTVQRNAVWGSELALWTDTVQKAPNKARPRVNLGIAFSKLGKNDVAIKLLTEALAIDSQYAVAHYNMAVVLAEEQQFDQAIHHYRQTLSLRPRDVKSHSNLANLLSARGHREEAIAHYRQAIRIDPSSPEPRFNLALELEQLGSLDEAAIHYRAAFRLRPELRAIRARQRGAEPGNDSETRASSK